MKQSAEYWLSRAEEARTIGEQMKDAEFRNTLLRIVERYDDRPYHAASNCGAG